MFELTAGDPVTRPACVQKGRARARSHLLLITGHPCQWAFWSQYDILGATRPCPGVVGNLSYDKHLETLLCGASVVTTAWDYVSHCLRQWERQIITFQAEVQIVLRGGQGETLKSTKKLGQNELCANELVQFIIVTKFMNIANTCSLHHKMTSIMATFWSSDAKMTIPQYCSGVVSKSSNSIHNQKSIQYNNNVTYD